MTFNILLIIIANTVLAQSVFLFKIFLFKKDVVYENVRVEKPILPLLD